MSNQEISAAALLTPPYAQIGMIECLWGNQGIRGTFALIGPNDILTASHLVFNPSLGGKPTSINFYLGADYNSVTKQFENLGTRLSYQNISIDYQPGIYSNANNDLLTASESEVDLAVIGLDQLVGNIYGYLQLNPLLKQVGSFNASAVGYPLDGTGMMERSVDPVLSNDLWVSQGEGLKPGNSGGPLLIGNEVVGVASAANISESIWASVGLNFDFILNSIENNNSLVSGGVIDPMLFDYSKAATAANQTLLGYRVNEGIFGGAGDDSIYGNGGDDQLYGNDGRDLIYGGSGNDLLNGDADNDILYGELGNDTLNGGLGNNTMHGGAGDDTYFIASSKDKIVELAGEGNDTVNSLIGFTLAANLENLGLLGLAKINGKGNALNNRLVGNAFANNLSGGAGDDLLDGGGGMDTLIGGSGNDRFVLHPSATSFSTVQDFAKGKDTLGISLTEFGLTANEFNASAFYAGKFASTASQHFIYDQSKGLLYFDSDGSGAEAMIKIGLIGNKSALNFNDFYAIA
jgi:Ca2+-binding RTX toxin-like protein